LTVWAITGGLCLLVLTGTYFLFVEKPPPKHLVIATGSADGAYYHVAQQYAELLKKDGITLEVRPTKGSVENLQLLTDPDSGVDVAIVQSGVATEEQAKNIAALASLYREPLWIFYRNDKPLKLVSQLEGKRLAIGPPGSGTQVTALQVLQANGIAPAKGEKKTSTQLLDLTGNAAAQALEKGEIDAAFFVASVETSYILDLMKASGIRLLSMGQYEAYQRNYRHLSRVRVPAGLIDLGKNLPDRDIDLVGPNAVLVVRHGFHSDLVGLLLAVATRVHGPGSRLAQPGEFPSPSSTGLPVHEDAAHYLKSGPPLLHRFLPFGVASLVDRLKIMLIPLIMLLMPLLRMTPPLVRWRVRRKIYVWYGLLRDIDEKLIAGASTEELHTELARLREIEQQVAAVDVPLSYMGEFHTMRFHLATVRSKLERLLAEKAEPEAASI
jgi:TRAP transporter TAXI family solute receptor